MFYIYWLLIKRDFSLNQAVLISLLGYLIFNKIINEQYVFIAMPFFLWDLSENPSRFRNMLYQLLWAIPLAFAIINVPILGFSFPLLNSLGLNFSKLALYADWITGSSLRLMFLRASAILFSLTAVCYTWYTTYKTHQTSLRFTEQEDKNPTI